jgi:hypothetical protein
VSHAKLFWLLPLCVCVCVYAKSDMLSSTYLTDLYEDVDDESLTK